MPLVQGKSKKAFGKNVETEMEAGKPQKQSLAIAYNVQKKNKKKKMALGGAVESETHSKAYSRDPGTPAPTPDDNRLDKDDYMAGDMDAPIGSTPQASTMITIPKKEYDSMRMAMGGMVPKGSEDTQEPMVPGAKADNDGRDSSSFMSGEMPDRLAKGGMARKHMHSLMDEGSSIADAIMDKRQKLAEGGMVDLEDNSEEKPNGYDDLNEDAANDPQYDDDQLSAQPEDSNEKGDDLEDADEHDMVDSIRRKMKSKRG